MSEFKIIYYELRSRSDVLKQLINQQLILRYRRTILGYFWTLINPLLMMSVMAFVFSSLFKEDLKTFAVFLFAGMIPWNFFSSVVTQSGSAYINNESLIKKIYLPKAIFPLSISIALLVDAILSFIALFLIILVIGGSLSWALFFLPISFILLFTFSLGCALIMSIATVFFRDLQHVIIIAMQGLFFLTPILYKKERLMGGMAWIIDLNPVAPFITLFRVPLVEGKIPGGDVLLQSILIAIFTMALGLWIYMRHQKKIVFRL